MQEVDKHSDKNVSKILVGNKKDLEDQGRAVAYNEGKDLADIFNIRFLETSAKNSSNVEEAFTLMTREIKSKVQTSKEGGKMINQQNQRVTLGGKNKKGQALKQEKKSGCC